MSNGRYQSGGRAPSASGDVEVEGDQDPDVLDAAARALNGYLRDGRWYDSRPYAAARFRAVLTRVYDDWRALRYEFRLVPRGAAHPVAGTTIVDDPAFAYRGMSWEEWQAALASGVVASLGEHNFSNQRGLTMFAPSARTAESYAGGFAPWMHQPAAGLPGVVVAVPRAGALAHGDHPGVPSDELAFDHPVAVADVHAAWFLVPTEIREGRLEVVVDKLGDRPPSEGSRMSPSVRYVVVEAPVSGRHRRAP